ncbi:DUF3772 domain-containing protein [Pseudoponticoccus marisrubri]|uniref:Mechanosensitive ion channel protein MscS n=1 Tax=Pseudoponticoccus marisrubri TaxID=1685382 RepID=A0A0W7WEI9_9RHOB|nr:DUF3772 domain-containing protein [Pseudoponticoccus marisrubri]KUF09056.1 mechanosensitive ion channel protein MscS [Pseudoponticoccus marisrubri]
MTQITRWITASLLALALLAGAALAQDLAGPDYDTWNSRADQAEQVIEEGRASDQALEDLRARIAGWREQFLAAQDTNASRIDTLQSQIDAIGPAPEDGTEDPEIAKRRAELNEQLARLRAPVLRAEEAYTRANGIIGEIDRIIRERQTDELLELGPSPLNPAYWPQAIEDLTQSLRNAWREIASNATSRLYQSEAQRNLPLILVLLAIGVMLLLRGRSWARTGVQMLHGGARRGTGVFRFMVSLGQIVLPLAGIYALSQAAFATGMMGPRWTLLLENLPIWATTMLGIHWLADQAFHDDDDIAALQLTADDRVKARAFASILAVLYVLRDVIDTLAALDNFPAETMAVAQFPVLVLSGYFLFRLGRVRNDAPMAGSAEARDPSSQSVFRLRLARLLGRAAIIIGVLGPVMAGIGYYRVGEALVYPAIATLALVGIVLVLQSFFNSLYEMVTGRNAEEDESLLPVLAGFMLSLAALPILALIWGARVADLTELWARFREGFQFGETRISPTDFLVVVIVFILGYLLTRLLQGALRTTILPKTKMDQGGQNAVVSGIGYVGIFLAALIAITAGGLDLSSLAIVAGALSVGIGFGLQNIVSNFVSGIILLIERPIGEGDWIEVNGTHGIVKDISVRSTRLETFDRYDLIIPNADFVSGTVANYTRGNSLGRIIVGVGVAYGSDTRKVEKVLLNIARQHDKVLMNPAPYVYFKGFGADSMDFEIRAILTDIGEGLAVRTEMNHQIAERFAEEGIEIPFAQRDVWLRNPETLTAKPPQEAAPASTEGGSGTPAEPSATGPARPEPGAVGADPDGDGR